MILADTSVVIQFWKAPNAAQQKVFADGQVAICGVTRAELYHGARNTGDLEIIMRNLDHLPEIEIVNSDWAMLGWNLFTTRTKGITVPLADALIATLGMARQFEVWSYDAHFPLMQKALPGLLLFNETA